MPERHRIWRHWMSRHGIAFPPCGTPMRRLVTATDELLSVTNLNDFNGPHQTTNLGVGSSNLSGRAISSCSTGIFRIAFSRPFSLQTQSGALRVFAESLCRANFEKDVCIW